VTTGVRLILLGAPGVGKGTQGALLAERHGLERIATGDILRQAVRDQTELGRKARRYMDAGELVPDHLILEMLRDVLADARHGFVLDGFPRTIQQAESLDRTLAELGEEVDAVVVLEAPDPVLVGRISGRRSCSGCGAVYNVHREPPRHPDVCDRCGGALVQREDDREETVLNRLRVYRRQTEPLIRYYQDAGTRVEVVDGDQPVHEVQADIGQALAPA
jgi:adenylate kinase